MTKKILLAALAVAVSASFAVVAPAQAATMTKHHAKSHHMMKKSTTKHHMMKKSMHKM